MLENPRQDIRNDIIMFLDNVLAQKPIDYVLQLLLRLLGMVTAT